MRSFSIALTVSVLIPVVSIAQELQWPPTLPGGTKVVTDTSPDFLRPTETLRSGVTIARTPPTIDFMYYSGQDYKANLWSAWGDNLAVEGKCYSAIGDHTGPSGNAFLYEYDVKTKTLKEVVDVKQVLGLPKTHYTPGKIHSRIDLGKDGWLYFTTHRGSTRVTVPANHYKGDWILRHHPQTHKTEIVAHAPLPNQCLPTGLLDPQRLIYYAGTADGDRLKKRVQFLAYDVKNRKVLYSDDYGPYRYVLFARSTGRVYFHGNTSSPSRTQGPGQLVRFDPDKPGPPTRIAARVGLRSATLETPQGKVYTIDHDELWEFDTKTEQAKSLGPTAVGSKTYTTSIDADPKTGRYLYYVPGAHGGAELDGSPLIQYDVKTRTRKVIAFLHPFYHSTYGYIPSGAFGTAVSPSGDKVYITWNGARGIKIENLAKRVRWNTCALMVVHIPESERRP